jgi:hypothetical protein
MISAVRRLQAMRYALVDGIRTPAAPRLRGICPGCRGEVIAKCGEIIRWHWSHVSAECDSWGDGESDWHIGWKDRFPPELQEVFMGEHRADIKGACGVLEVQASPISTETIEEREKFYGEMAWMLKGEDFVDNFYINYAGDGTYFFTWKRPRLSWQFSSRRIYIDFPFGIFRPDFSNGVSRGIGVFVPPSEVYEFVSGSHFVVPECAKDWYLSASELYEKRALVNSIALKMSAISYRIWEIGQCWFRKFLNLRQIRSVPAWVESENSSQMPGGAIWKNTNKYLCEVEQWKAYLNEAEDYAEQWAIEDEKRRKEEEAERERYNREIMAERERRFLEEAAIKAEEEAARVLKDLEEQARRDEAARISAEKLRLEIARQKAEEEKREKERLIALRSVSLQKQAEFLSLENSRMFLCDQIRSIRPVESEILGRWATQELIGLKSSLQAAKLRLGESRWSSFVEQGRHR